MGNMSVDVLIAGSNGNQIPDCSLGQRVYRNLPEMRPLKNAPALSFPRRRESRNIGTL
jgi:hypothetical protein